MVGFNKSILPLIESRLGQMTRNEVKIARYFLQECGADEELSARAVAKRLGVSDASLTRFAQKCGFKGYRTFAYAYQPPAEERPPDNLVAPVLASYQELLNKTYSIVDMAQIKRITTLMNHSRRVYIYGKGSSGTVAREMKLRFMRIGLVCEALTDDDLLRINAVILDRYCLVIGISISGKTRPVTDALSAAKAKHARTVLLTANPLPEFAAYCDEVQLIALKNNLENGRSISPQLPALMVFDILYADFLNTNKRQRDAIWQQTYEALHPELNHEHSHL